MTITTDELAALTAELVEINSVNPDLVPGGAGEAEIERLVAAWPRDAGLEVELPSAARVANALVAIATEVRA